MECDAQPSLNLLQLLSNPLIFLHTYPYLPISGLLTLSATCKAFRNLIYSTPGVFRSLDLSTAKGASVNLQPIDRGGEKWRSQRMDEHVTEEDFYCGPLRGIFAYLRRMELLGHVQTLILDGQSAPAEILHEIISEEQYQIRILSVIGSKNFNESKFRQILRYAIRPTRPEGTPKLKGVYLFGTTAAPRQQKSDAEYCEVGNSGVTASVGAQLGTAWNQRSREALSRSLHCHGDPWYTGPGRVLPKLRKLDEWAPVLHACQGIIAFDAVLCQGPKHLITFRDVEGVEYDNFMDPAIASVALEGCQKCHSIPEGPIWPSKGPSSRLPLLSPPPRNSASIKRAQQPVDAAGAVINTPLYARCSSCLAHRCCENCYKFWCENCYPDGDIQPQLEDLRISNPALEGNKIYQKPGTKRDCWECGRLSQCEACNALCQRLCKCCGFYFCVMHNDGSTVSTCDWCQFSRRRGRELY